MEKYNSEGYYDPTAHEALSRIAAQEKADKKAAHFRTFDGYRPLVYICSPHTGEIAWANEDAKKYSRFALERNAIPIAPHLLYSQFMHMDDPTEQSILRNKIQYVLIGKCDELWSFGGALTGEMLHEISVAMKRRMKIRYFTAEMREIL